MSFQAPIAETLFTMREIAGLPPGLDADTAGDVLAEAGRFAGEVLAPLNRVGDRAGVRLEDGAVRTAPGWPDAYRKWRSAGWNGISAPEEWGGQGLPQILQAAVAEFWNSGSAAFAVGPMLTAGAIEALAAHADDALKRRYLPPLVSGVWMASMNLTEPQAGSDLGAITTRAERAGDGSYRIHGQKIFITYGDHDLCENIAHLVLARLADAPLGTAGISMFLVPKFLVGDDGSLGKRNAVSVAGIEDKLGLHGSPTCTLIHDGATGWLVGEENRGLAAMFTMMNSARLGVGIQGVGVAERAYQEALAYARQRRQGRGAGGRDGAMAAIIEHPDVRAMLLRMKALTAASRAICHACAHAIDMSRSGPAGKRAEWSDRAGLLTPLAKAFSTDAAIEVASLGIQVHGGAGYIEATGAAQHLRDARIFPIYEGTNGIQAIDLVTRKLKLADGRAVRTLIGELEAIAARVEKSNRPQFGSVARRLRDATGHLAQATEFLLASLADGQAATALAGATPYLRLLGLTAGGALLAKGALADEDGGRWVALARYFAETMVAETGALALAVTEGAPALDQATDVILAPRAADRP